jgi:glucose-6-phosphate 1-dehydrogenase
MQTDSSFTFVLFGGTGDLSMRKILPALYEAHRAGGMLAESGKIVAVARHVADRAAYLDWVGEHVKPHVSQNGVDETAWASFLARIEFVKIDLGNPEDFTLLREALSGRPGIRVFYLATGPSLFVPICHALASVGLNENSRIVLEKPLGYDLKSSNAINDAVGEIFAEEQIYRIDHYLGKEPVQNLLALRFGNVLFEPLWRREWVESIQITIAEELGVEARGDFYDNTGALRDMVQNHLLQLLSIVAMEPPLSMDSDSVRDEKLRVLRALKPIDPRDIGKIAVRGQYHAGVIRGSAVPAYATEPGVKADSATETFVAVKVEIENWRWAGVPFFLRTGKRLSERLTEIVVTFEDVPHSIFEGPSSDRSPNRLVIRLQPQESITLTVLAKQPGETMRLKPVNLALDLAGSFKEKPVDAYERLIMDVVKGNLTLFMRRDELDAAWRWIDPIRDGWARHDERIKSYTSGSWGPAASSALVSRDGFAWQDES